MRAAAPGGLILCDWLQRVLLLKSPVIGVMSISEGLASPWRCAIPAKVGQIAKRNLAFSEGRTALIIMGGTVGYLRLPVLFQSTP